MKTAGRQHTMHTPHQPFKGKLGAYEPDRIILPIRDEFAGSHELRPSSVDYTDYEEVMSSDTYDELAFQEYADDDPTRLRVSSRRGNS